jgi:dUTP pyrophosphatase
MKNLNLNVYDNLINKDSVVRTTAKVRIPVKVYDERQKSPEFTKEESALPEYATSGSAGLDLRAFVWHGITESYMGLNSIFIEPGETKLISTGLYVEIPEGYEMQIRSRSGLSLKGIIVKNSPGTIDSDYRGLISVILWNTSDERFYIENNMKIAQAVLAPVVQLDWELVSELSELNDTDRGSGGFGSTGK